MRPKALSKELRLNIVQSHHQPLYEKNKRLRSITFADFQQFCRHYCDQVRIKALMQGNIHKDHAMEVMQNVLNDLKCGHVEDVSFCKRIPFKFNFKRIKIFLCFTFSHTFTTYSYLPSN